MIFSVQSYNLLMTRSGTDITIVAHSRSVGMALDAAQALESKGIKAEVIQFFHWSKRPILNKQSRLLICDPSGPLTLTPSSLQSRKQTAL